MKKLITFLLIIGIATGINAQKKGSKKKLSEAEKAAIEAAKDAAEIDTIATYVDIVGENNASYIDTLNIVAGKKYVILIKADEWNSQSFDDDQEEKELRKNFPQNSFEIIKIEKYSYINFGNGQFLDASSSGNSYDAIAYWSGKNNDDIQVKEGRAKATEFVAKQLGVKKESSYIINDKKYKKEIADLLAKQDFTPKSKEVMDYYLKQISTPLISYLGDKELIFNQNHDKVKTIKTYFVDKKGQKKIYEEIIFNENGKPFSLKHFGSKGNQKSMMKFVYENNILKQILGEESETNISYHDGQMIFSKNVGEADDTTIFYFEKGKILQKSYTIMQDENATNINSYSEETVKDGCVLQTINSELWKKTCSSKTDEFPFNYTYTSYQDGKVLQTMADKVIKKSANFYEQFVSDEDGKSTLRGTYHLNEKNLITSFDFAKDNDTKKLEVEYSYFP